MYLPGRKCLTFFGTVLDKLLIPKKKNMKITKILSIALLSAAWILFCGCPKKKPNVPPEPDTDLQSSVDVSNALFAITDVEMIAAFIAENDDARFYTPSPDANPNNYTKKHSLANQTLFAAFVDVKCLDGKKRSGTVAMDYSNSTNHAYRYHDYKFAGQLSLLDYRQDGWLIRNYPLNQPCYVYNQISTLPFNPAATNMSWLIEGGFEFIHPTDPSRNMIVNAKLIKTLANTSDKNVYSTASNITIDWTKSLVNYSGEASGTRGNESFSLKINEGSALKRDMTCYPDKIGGISSVQPTFKTWNREFHPFMAGVMSFKPGDKYPRQIYFGNEGNPELNPQCDNSGEVLIKGISYRVDFVN
jgi:hypothetical protein